MLKTAQVIISIVVGAFLIGMLVAAQIAKSRQRLAAPNIAPYYPDDKLENQRLTRGLGWLVALLALLAVTLPAYWLVMPWVQDQFEKKTFIGGAEERGAERFATIDEGGLGCAGCHGDKGQGGSAPFVYNDPATGKPLDRVAWLAPSLNDAFRRFSEAEITRIVTCGRPGTPMPAWGNAIEGCSGSLNRQGVEDLVAYIKSIQIDDDKVANKQIEDRVAQYKKDHPGVSEGEALFNVNCARCHTPQYSFSAGYKGTFGKELELENGAGAYGPNLTGENNEQQFPKGTDQEKFVANGSTANQGYGTRGIGTGRMPSFNNPDRGQLLTPEQIEAIVEYERGL